MTLKKRKTLSGSNDIGTGSEGCPGQQGPAITRNITLPGRYVVLEPFGSRISLSRKIESKTKRSQLREWASQVLPPKMGLVLRTAAASADKKEIQADVENSSTAGKSSCAGANWGGDPIYCTGNWTCPSG